MCLELLF
jgi:hexokinase